MMYQFITAILIIGLSGLVAQVVLLRELLVSFYGNELTVGIVLANWLVCEAAGVFLAGKIVDKIRRKLGLFIFFELCFVWLFPISVYLARVYKDMLGIPAGEGIGFSAIFWVSLFILLPGSFSHGALFSTGCRIYPLFRKDAEAARDKPEAASIGKVYAWEIIGTIAGGIVLTYLFLPYLNSFQIALTVGAVNLLICFLLLNGRPARIQRIVLFCSVFNAFYLQVSGTLGWLERYSVSRQFKQGEVLDYRNSVYGNVAVTRQSGQLTFFSNGIPVITTPYPNITFVEDFAHLPLLFHPHPREILVSAAGAGGLLHEILKHPVTAVDYTEIDPLIISMLKQHPTVLTESELSDPRVHVAYLDPRFFLKKSNRAYDIIFIGISNPGDLVTNRLFTEEFFSLAGKRLKTGGILALWLPGSLSYLSTELATLNASILRSLQAVYPYTRVIPGDYNIFLASASSDLSAVTADELAGRLDERKLKTGIMTPRYLAYRLDKQYVEWFKKNVSVNTAPLNKDLRPVAVFQTLLLWNKEFSPRIFPFLKNLQNFDTKVLGVIIALLTAFIVLVGKCVRRPGIALAYAIATTGFFGMLANLILVFGFQIFYGYLYHRIGLLISIFMAGTAAGSMLITETVEKGQSSIRRMLYIEAAIIVFSCLLAFVLPYLSGVSFAASWLFGILFFICGMLIGLEFPLAGALYLGKSGQLGATAGMLYFSDLIGGWCAGILAGIACMAVIGVFWTCMLIVLFKLGSFIVLKSAERNIR